MGEMKIETVTGKQFHHWLFFDKLLSSLLSSSDVSNLHKMPKLTHLNKLCTLWTQNCTKFDQTNRKAVQIGQNVHFVWPKENAYYIKIFLYHKDSFSFSFLYMRNVKSLTCSALACIRSFVTIFDRSRWRLKSFVSVEYGSKIISEVHIRQSRTITSSSASKMNSVGKETIHPKQEENHPKPLKSSTYKSTHSRVLDTRLFSKALQT